ncbi:50S ribosomal protein L32e [Candidatus Pyrohabitans sp.]
MRTKKKPEFKRVDYHRHKKLSRGSWRRPKGRHSKTRIYKKGKFLSPRIGYGNDASLRGLHPSGYREVLVHNLAELEGIDASSEAVRISARVGRRKRLLMLEKAKELNIKVLNPPSEA